MDLQSEGSVFAPSGAGKPEACKTPLEIMLIHIDHVVRRLCIGLFVGVCLEHTGLAQRSFTWQEVRDKFEATNPTLRALAIGIDENKAQEITAYLRPNPDFTLATDGTQIAPYQGVWRPFAGTQVSTEGSYLHERQHKRELRLESAQKGTAVAESSWRIRSEHCSSICELLLFRRFSKKPSWRWPETIFPITTISWGSVEIASRPATSPMSTSIGWSCSACSTNRTCKPRM